MLQSDFLLDGRYLLGAPLGEGAMAEVCRAHDTRLGQDVAVKRLRPEQAKDAVALARFRREAEVAAGNRQANTVAVTDTGEYFDNIAKLTIPYLVMELIEGEVLSEILDRDGKLPALQAIAIIRAVLAALAFSHQRGIIHRDIKPSNVMISRTGEVKVLDFGIAGSEKADKLTATNSVPGTPCYLSPEQCLGESGDARSDLYATGCLLYELLTGEPVFTGPTTASVVLQHTTAAPPPPSKIASDLPGNLDEICLMALAKDPSQRYQTAQEMQTALAGVQVPDPVSRRSRKVKSSANRLRNQPAVAVERAKRRKGYRWISLIVALLLLLGGGAIGWLAKQHSGDPSGLGGITPSTSITQKTTSSSPTSNLPHSTMPTDQTPPSAVTASPTETLSRVTYDFSENGGSSATITSALLAEGMAVDLSPTASKAGWVFVGWSTSKDATTGLTSWTMPATAVTLYAIFSKTMIVTLKDYRGTTPVTRTVSTTIFNKQVSGTVTLPVASIFEGVAWQFRCWSEGTTATSPVVSNPYKMANDVTLYAIYQRPLTQIFVTGDPDTPAPAPLSNLQLVNSYDKSAPWRTEITLPRGPDRPGYTFTGWKMDLPPSHTYAGLEVIAPWSNTTFTAQWKAT
ncbi:MAG: protein kinase [Propionibacteriaceae bacterium]|jgi:uncharacterized repeat protein (TIGR02543 family)|nr:protein kinase [Propionibacteriaceae bacterium]